jgi:signal transduction histidine kinase/ligand-binding sensor domain-containing protein
MKSVLALVTIGTFNLLLGSSPVPALDPSLEISQYAHTGWTVRDGFFKGNIYAMAQTPDGYLWLGTEFGLFRFDGVRSVPWQPPAGQHLPDKNINSLLVTRDGTLWIGTFAGLATWNGTTLTARPEAGTQFVSSLFEDNEGTVWAGTAFPSGRLCAVRNGSTQCYGEDGAFGRAVWALYEDSSGTLWAAAQSGLWRLKPGPPKRYATPTELIGLSKADDGRLLIAMHGAGLLQLTGDKVGSYPVRSPINRNQFLGDRDIDANRVLRDRDGGLWIGTVERGLLHVHHGRTEVFTKSDGLSGDIILSVLEDREGDVWVASTGGLDRFRELPVSTISVKQGLSSDATQSVLAAADGSIWIGAHDRLTRWQNGKATIFGKANGLPDDAPESLYQDEHGRIWVFTAHGLAYFRDGRFVALNAVIPSREVYSITGDKAGNLWLSGEKGLLHLLDGRFVEHFPWSALGRRQQAKVVLSDQGGVWLSFWIDGGVLYFKDGQVRASYTAANGLGEGHVPGLHLDRDGALWAATEEGGLSRIKDGRITSLTSGNGLPCDAIYWVIEDDDRSLWLYTGCGLVRITRAELNAWIADPKYTIATTVWDPADGVRIRSSAASPFGPTVTRSTDDKLWFLTGDGVQVVDPHHLANNQLPPPVRIEQIVADHKTYWQNLTGAAILSVRLPAMTRDLAIDYTALSLVAPEKVHFKYKLEGQDREWREVVNDREVQYSNLAPGTYRFRVIASNNSGVWNLQGDTLEFSVAPAYYQTDWFRALCAIFLLVLLWAAYQFRIGQLQREFALTLDARVGERISIARDLHDTLLQSFHGLLLRFQTVLQLLPDRPIEAKEKLEGTIERAVKAITEGRDAVQGLRDSTIQTNDLAQAVSALGEELAIDPGKNGSAAIRVTVEGEPRDLHPILRDEIYRIAAEALRNAYRHAQARRIEVEIRYDNEQFRLRVRDDGKGIDPAILSRHESEGHYGLPGMRERAKLIGGKLAVWSEVDAGTEVELGIPAGVAYATASKRSWLSQLLAGNDKSTNQEKTP